TGGDFDFDQVVGGQMVYTRLGGLGPEWEFGGNGFLLGDGNAGFLIRNIGNVAPGALYVGEEVGGVAVDTSIGGVGREGHFAGNADFLGDGQSQYLIRNAGNVIGGTLYLGEVKNSAVGYTALGGLGLEWELAGNGDFLGDGRQGFLIRNTGGVSPGTLDIG